MSIADQSITSTTPTAAVIPAVATTPGGTTPARVPKLHNGDHLTRAEFERRYSAMPEVKGAQLIEGIVYMPSPVRYTSHGGPHSSLMAWLGLYRVKTPQLLSGDNTTNRLDNDNEPQPDAVMFLPAAAGGQASIDGDGYIAGAPELVCEISASSVSIDMNDKLNVYRRNGVKEYLVWRVEDGAIDWFELVEGRYAPLAADKDGIVRSKMFPGLWLDVPAMLRDDLAAVAAGVDAGTASSEHAEFKSRLQAAAGSTGAAPKPD